MSNEPLDVRDQISRMKPSPGALPYLTPDEIDEFIDYVIDRYDLMSFSQSTIEFRTRTLKAFMKDRENRLETPETKNKRITSNG